MVFVAVIESDGEIEEVLVSGLLFPLFPPFAPFPWTLDEDVMAVDTMEAVSRILLLRRSVDDTEAKTVNLLAEGTTKKVEGVGFGIIMVLSESTCEDVKVGEECELMDVRDAVKAGSTKLDTASVPKTSVNGEFELEDDSTSISVEVIQAGAPVG